MNIHLCDMMITFRIQKNILGCMGPELYVFKYIYGNIYAEETSHANVIVFYIQFYKEI